MARTPAVLLLALLLLASALFNPLAGTAQRYSRDAAVAAVAIYATLRSMTALLSIVRDADVGVSFPVEATFSPGQTLTPLTQTVERFADIMFVVALWSAALAVLLGPAAAAGAVVAGSAMLVAVVLARTKRAPPAEIRRLLHAVTTLGLVLAVLVPLAYSLAYWLGDTLTDDATRHATAVLMRAPTEPTALPTEQMPGWADVRRLLDEAASILNMADDIFEATVNLSVAYLLKLVVLPVLLMFGFWWLARAARAPLVVVDRSRARGSDRLAVRERER